MTATHAPRLTASTVSALVRRAIGAGNAKVSTGSQIEQDGALVTVSVRVTIHGAKAPGVDRDLLGRAVAAAALQAGYEVGGASSVLTITLPEPVEVDEVVPAVVVEQDAPRQDLDGEFRHEATCTPDPAACTCTPRYWTAEEVAAEAAALAEQVTDEDLAVAASTADGTSADLVERTLDAVRDRLAAPGAVTYRKVGEGLYEVAVDGVAAGRVARTTPAHVTFSPRWASYTTTGERIASGHARRDDAGRAVVEHARQATVEQPGADGLVHLLSDDLLDACGTAGPGGLVLAPHTTPERITCPRCRPLAVAERIADAILDRRPALLVFRPEVAPADAERELSARPLTVEEREALSAGVRIANRRLREQHADEAPRSLEWSEVARPAHVPASVPDAEVDRYLDAYPYPGA